MKLPSSGHVLEDAQARYISKSSTMPAHAALEQWLCHRCLQFLKGRPLAYSMLGSGLQRMQARNSRLAA